MEAEIGKVSRIFEEIDPIIIGLADGGDLLKEMDGEEEEELLGLFDLCGHVIGFKWIRLLLLYYHDILVI